MNAIINNSPLYVSCNLWHDYLITINLTTLNKCLAATFKGEIPRSCILWALNSYIKINLQQMLVCPKQDKNMFISQQINFSSHPLCWSNFDTSSQQCIRAIASERRIMLSSCRTVILHEDLATPEPSLWRRRLYCSTMKSSDSLEICLRTSLKSEYFYLMGAVLNIGLRDFQVETFLGN